MNQPWIYMCFPSQSPLPPLSPSHPSGSSQCTSPEHLSHASNLDWRSVSPLIVYLFQCYSLRTSHPCLLSQSPKVCSVHLSLFLLIYTNGFKVFFILVKSLNHVQHFTTPWTVVHQAPLSMGFFQAKVLEWVAIFSSRGSSWPRDRIWSPIFQADTLPSEPPGKPHSLSQVMNIVFLVHSGR